MERAESPPAESRLDVADSASIPPILSRSPSLLPLPAGQSPFGGIGGNSDESRQRDHNDGNRNSSRWDTTKKPTFVRRIVYLRCHVLDCPPVFMPLQNKVC